MKYSAIQVALLTKDPTAKQLVIPFARIEQEALFRDPEEVRAWKTNGQYVGLLQISPGAALDSGAFAFSSEEASRIRAAVRAGKRPPADIIARLVANDSPQLQAIYLDFLVSKVRHKSSSAADYYWYHQQGIYSNRHAAMRGKQSEASKRLFGRS